MRWVAVAAAVVASGAWALFAFVLAAHEDIEGGGDGSLIAADVALAAIGIAFLLLSVRARLGARVDRIGVFLAGAGAAFVAWLVVAGSMAP